MEYGTLLFEVDAGVARIILNRPDAANALNLDLARELSDVALLCDEDRSVRAVVIGANGRFFCSGGDLAWFRGAGDAMPAAIKELATNLHTAISRFARMRAPVVMAVGGTAAGAGMSLACAGATEAYGITKGWCSPASSSPWSRRWSSRDAASPTRPARPTPVRALRPSLPSASPRSRASRKEANRCSPLPSCPRSPSRCAASA